MYRNEFKYRYGVNARQHQVLDNAFRDISPAKCIPFEFKVSIPPPLRTGVDYGFIKKVKNDIIPACQKQTEDGRGITPQGL